MFCPQNTWNTISSSPATASTSSRLGLLLHPSLLYRGRICSAWYLHSVFISGLQNLLYVVGALDNLSVIVSGTIIVFIIIFVFTIYQLWKLDLPSLHPRCRNLATESPSPRCLAYDDTSNIDLVKSLVIIHKGTVDSSNICGWLVLSANRNDAVHGFHCAQQHSVWEF